MGIKAEIRASLGWTWTAGAVLNDRLAYAAQLLDGNGDNQAEAAWLADDQSLTSGTSTTLDLTALTRSLLGDTHTTTLLGVRGLLILNHHDSAGNLVVGGASSNAWSAPFADGSDKLSLPPDGIALLTNRKSGWTVDASNCNLKLLASGGNVDYSIALIGTITAPSSSSS
jgi:hypothetical protein